MRIVLAILIGVSLLGVGCEEWRENAGSTTGPGIDVHCDAASPVGNTTVKVDCPNPQ